MSCTEQKTEQQDKEIKKKLTMIIKIQDQDLLLLVAPVCPNYPGVFPPPPLALFYARNFSGLERKSNQESRF